MNDTLPGQPARDDAGVGATKTALGNLMGIVEGIVCDNQLADAEVRFLARWLDANKQAAAAFPGSIIARRVSEVLSDGILTDDEKTKLLADLKMLSTAGLMDAVPELRDGVDLVAGEARLRHLYASPGATDGVLARWREVMGDRAIVERRENLADWFGPIAADVRGRFGDVIVASLGDFAVFSSLDFPQEFQLRGFHGSVTEAELAIPLLVSAG